MFDNIIGLFKKKRDITGLEKAYDLGLITQRELLEMKVKRAERDLERYENPVKSKVRVRQTKTA